MLVHNQNDCNAEWLLFCEDDETLSHFLLEYSALEETRRPIMQDVLNAIDDIQNRLATAVVRTHRRLY